MTAKEIGTVDGSNYFILGSIHPGTWTTERFDNADGRPMKGSSSVENHRLGVTHLALLMHRDVPERARK